ncbi:MAG: hypothetical protein AAF722_01895 [Cyanobacteria bacterium P01_C01_bin.70]
MNAANCAITLELTSKVAHLAVLIRAAFVDVRVDLSPWLTSTETHRQLDPHSIDLSFYFPKRHVGMECRCILLQVRFFEGLLQPTCALSHIEASAYDCTEPQWTFSTATDTFMGLYQPSPEYQARFRHIMRQIFELFKYPNQLKITSDHGA